MAGKPIYFRQAGDVEVTVWKNSEGEEFSPIVRFAKRTNSPRPSSKFTTDDMQVIILLALDVRGMFHPLEPSLDADLDEIRGQ